MPTERNYLPFLFIYTLNIFFQIAIFSLISFVAAQYGSQDKEVAYTQGYEVTTPVSICNCFKNKINILQTNILADKICILLKLNWLNILKEKRKAYFLLKLYFCNKRNFYFFFYGERTFKSLLYMHVLWCVYECLKMCIFKGKHFYQPWFLVKNIFYWPFSRI